MNKQFKNNLIKRLICIIPIILLSISVKIHAQETEILSFAKTQMQQYHIPAISILVTENGQVMLEEALGVSNLEYDIPNDLTTAFQLASVTKLLTASAVMILVQNHQLDLHKQLKCYLPGLPEAWKNMKVIDLLAHQSGIADLLVLQHNFSSVDEALDTAKLRPLDFEPGTKTVYAGADYAVVMKLIEYISGSTFQEFIKKELFEKLGMNHTAYNNMEQDFIYRTYDTMSYAATVYKWDDTDQKQRIFSMLFPKWTYPAGGLYSSIDDLKKWMIALDNNLILEPKYCEMMWTPACLRDGSTSPFGVGWIVDRFGDQTATGHSGGPALADVIRLSEEKISVIVLTNQMELQPFLAMKILEIYMNTKK